MSAAMYGFRVRSSMKRPDPQLVARLLALPVANVSDCMSRLNAGGAGLRAYHNGQPLCGPALTVKSRPGDNLMMHKAIDIAFPGDVIVCDAGGDLTNAIIGELMLAHAKMRGVAGFVIYGAIRDAKVIAAQNLPVFALGVTHRGPYKDGPGEIGCPISLNGMVVAPGDVILGDEDGVLSVPAEAAINIAERAEAKAVAEARQMQQTLERQLDRSWVDAKLLNAGCIID